MIKITNLITYKMKKVFITKALIIFILGKRKLLWNIWEKGIGEFGTYEQLKKFFWDPNNIVFFTIYKDIKQDLRQSINNMINSYEPILNKNKVDKSKSYINIKRTGESSQGRR